MDKSAIIQEYQELLNISREEEVLTISFSKLAKIYDEIKAISDDLYSGEMDDMEAMVRLDILLGACAEIKSDLKTYLIE